MKIYVVGDWGYEHNQIKSVHKTYRGAFKAWNKLRCSLLETAKSRLKSVPKDEKYIYKDKVKILSCTCPEKMKDSVGETPYLQQYELEE